MANCYWMFQDYVNGLCSRADVGSIREGAHALTLDEPRAVVQLDIEGPLTPALIVETACRTLLRAAQQSRDLPSAVKAAAALLRYYAPPQVPGQPLDMPEPATVPAEPWLTARRHLYQQAMENGGFEALAQPAPACEAPSEALDPPYPTPPLPERPAAEPRLYVVERPPTFYDGPGVPASGPYRGS